MVAVPTTVTRLSHALTIRAGRHVIGAIHQWAPSMRRSVDAEFEVETNSYGMPVDLVPQAMETRELRIARYDTYPEIMEEVFGSRELIVLVDQYRPFSIRETWRGPGINLLGGAGTALGGLSSLAGSLGATGPANAANKLQADFTDEIGAAASSEAGSVFLSVLGAVTADTRIYEYSGCYFTDIGRQIDAKSDRVISVDATLVWLTRRRVA